MNDLMPFLLFFVGFILIIKGSDWFLDATIWVAKVLHIPNIIIGATIVSLCTTLPEAMVSSSSALKGNADIAFGNALGSIACNTGFILAVTIILSKPPITNKKSIIKQGLFLLSMLGLLTAFALVFGELNIIAGVTFLAILVYYLYSNVKEARISKTESIEDDKIDKSKNTIIRFTILFIVGIIMTIIGANILVTNGEKIARIFGVPDVIIGLTLTALGTSLPELVTAITAVVKKAHDISIGNVLGANILNIILVLGISSSILPIKIDPSYLNFHIPFVTAIVATVFLFAVFSKKYLHRYQGFVILAMYSGYIYLMFR